MPKSRKQFSQKSKKFKESRKVRKSRKSISNHKATSRKSRKNNRRNKSNKKSKNNRKVRKSVKKVSKSIHQTVNIEVNLFEKDKNTSIDPNDAIKIIRQNYKKIELWYKFNIFQMYGLRNLKVVYKNKNKFIISFKSAFIFQKCHMELLADPDFEERYVIILEKEVMEENLKRNIKFTYNIHGNLV